MGDERGGEGPAGATSALAVCVALAVLVGGCAFHRGGIVGESSRVIREETRSSRVSEPWVHVSQSGAELTVRGELLCQVHRAQRLERTRAYGRESNALVPMVLLGVAGGAGVAIGGLFAANVFGFPASAAAPRSDTSTLTAETALIGGIALVGVGAVLAGLSVGHFFGLLPRDAEVSEEMVDLGPSGEPASCQPPTPYAGGVVRLGVPAREGRVQLGALDARGELVVDAALVVPPALALGHPSPSIPVLVADRPAGVLELSPLRARLDERVWAAAESSRCAAAEVPEHCARLGGYVRLFPEGAHAAAARAVLDTANQRLAARAARAEAERQVREETLRADAERRRQEADRRYAEEERQRREERAGWQRQQQARADEATARRRQAAERSAQRGRRAECARECARTCSNDPACARACAAQQCR